MPAPEEGTAPDEVDRIVTAWRRERPDLDVSPLEVLSRVTRLSRHLDLTRKSAFTASGLEAWEFDVLTALRRSGSPYHLTPGELIRQMLVSSGTMTNRVDRLVLRGLVHRTASTTDRRAILVGLTAEGRALVDHALGVLVEHEQTLLRDVSVAEQAGLAAVLRSLLARFEQRPD